MVVDVEKVARYIELANNMLVEESVLVYEKVYDVLDFLKQVQHEELHCLLFLKALKQFPDQVKLELSECFLTERMVGHIKSRVLRVYFDSILAYIEFLMLAQSIMSAEKDQVCLNYEIGFEYYYLHGNVFWEQSYQYLSSCCDGNQLSLLPEAHQSYLY